MSENFLSIDDFRSSGWKGVLSDASVTDYSSMWQALSAGARQAAEAGRDRHARVLKLLADACSMMLSPRSPNAPFKPFLVVDGNRSPLPEDFSEDEVAFLGGIVYEIDNDRLRARIADIVWLRQTPRDSALALTAIESYRRLELAEEVWVRDGRESWERAISLARMMRGSAETQLSQMEEAVLESFRASTKENGFLALWLSELLLSNGLARTAGAEIAQKLEDFARAQEDTGHLYKARDYFAKSIEWWKSLRASEKVSELTAAIGRTWENEAIARMAADDPSYMVAASFYENAIQTFRAIPRRDRESLGVDRKIEELRAKLNEAGSKSMGEMGVVSSPRIDISDLIDHARAQVSGKAVKESLLGFVSLVGTQNIAVMRQEAIDQIKRFPISSLFEAVTKSKDGRVVSKRPAMSLGATISASDEIGIRAAMVRNFGMKVALAVQGEIIPALEILVLEHRLQERDFIGLARQSPIVPPGRERLMGKALALGYDTDFSAAIHMLVPQIEHMVRFHLKQAGVRTTNLDADGIENEHGLSTLMKAPEADFVFGSDIAFEIRAIFCDEFGPNLRNELAHGLLDDETSHSSFVIYAWWFALKLVLLAWWNSQAQAGPGTEPTEPA